MSEPLPHSPSTHAPRPGPDSGRGVDPPAAPAFAGRARGDRRLLLCIVAGAVFIGAAASWHYGALGLTLSHYDAKAHLVVARRIFDSLTPGWRQVGAVWLPLPHLLNAVPVQIDAFYRSGLSGVLLSMAAFVTTVGAATWMVLRATGSRLAAVSTAAIVATDPNLLYLQATPMTEPVLLGLTTTAVALTYRWVNDGSSRPALPGWFFALACLTRYEAWPVTAAALALAGWARWRRGAALATTLRDVSRIGAFPLAAIAAFLVLSRATVGEWFVTGGFYVIDNKAYHQPFLAVVQVWWGLRQLIGTVTLICGVAGAVVVALVALRGRRHAGLLLSLALAGTAALPWFAFFSGHPFRIRYMAVLAVWAGVSAGLGVGLVSRRVRGIAAIVVLAAALIETPPFWAGSPLVAEAQWDRPNSLGRRRVTACLAADFARPDEKILASMGSLAHYMQELSHAGFRIDDFIHEGIGELWPAALATPRRHVDWILFEERAEGGDMLTAERRRNPGFVTGFARVCEGGGVALYRRSRD